MRRTYKVATLALCLLSSATFAELYRGSLFKDGEINKAKVLVGDEYKTLDIKIPQKYHKYMDKVLTNSPAYVFEYDGEIDGEQIVIENMPRVVADLEDRIGVLTKSEDGFYIDSQRSKFGRTKKIYGYQFDEKSMDYFVGKKVHTQGHIEDGIYIINAIIPADLFTAKLDSTYPASKKFKKKPLSYVLNKMPKNKYSQSTVPFKGTIRHRDNYQPSAGDHFVVVTLSGRQGDEPGSAAGHFAIGMGKVQNDMSLKGETFNFYFKGEKEVLASNTDLVSYFGHLIQGQVNYRPTYTLISYSKSKEDLLKARDLFEEQLFRVRTDPTMEITPFFNCTTTSNETFEEIGIKGDHKFLISNLLDYQTYLPMSYAPPKEGTKASMLSQLRYILKSDSEYYVPRKAFESFAKSMVRQSKALKLKRTDYIFLPQTPSARPTGGISYDEVLKEGKKVIEFRDARVERKKKEKEALSVLNSETSTEEEKRVAQEIVDKTVSPEEDQKQINEILYKID